MTPALRLLAPAIGLSKLDITLIVALVPAFVLACVDVGLISIIRWLVRR